MAKKIYETLKKDILQNQIKLLERKVVVANEYIRVVENKYKDKITKKLESKKRKNRKTLLPLEKQTVSRKDYNQSIIDKKMSEYDEKVKWQKIALDHSVKKKIAKEASKESIYLEESKLKKQTIDSKRESYLENLKLKYPLADLDQKIVDENKLNYNEKANKLELELQELEKKIVSKYNEKLEKDREKNQKQLLSLNQKLSVKKEKMNQIVTKEKEKLLLRKEELTNLIENKEDLRHEEYLKELGEIDALFEMYEDDTILLRVKNLNMNFGGLKAVDNLSFDIKKGEIFGLIGPNGAGKTTVFNCITQFYKPSSGKIYFSRKDQVVNLMDVKVHDVIEQGIVRTFQNVELVWELSVLDNLLVASHTLYESNFFTQLLHLPKLKKEEDVLKAKAMRVLDYLDLTPYKDVYPIGLPYGILKRIELARTFMTDPELIILDEPAAGLNEKETSELSEIIRKIGKDFGTTIFLVEHDMGLVMDVCDRICAINFGKKLAIGTPKEIQSNKLVQEAYLGGE